MFDNQFFQRSSLWQASTLLDFTPLSKAQREHLTKVYATLALCTVITFAGAIVPLRYLNHHSVLIGLAYICLALYVVFSGPRVGGQQQPISVKRCLALSGMAFAQGLLLRELVIFVLYLNPEILTTSLFATIAIFACFSIASLCMSSRLALYLGGLATSVSFYIVLVRLTNIFIRSKFVDDVSDIVMLLSFCGFIILDTQITLRAFDHGSRDYVLHAVMLYCDILNVFLKITKILCKKEEKKKEKSESRSTL
ncbi:Bax inhibitor-1, putative [Babesia bigemina]|uniref:Bax inhibitor-1, putative n=1 Tax=Babesia bigemina TaxID=5866 RepID=A0A061DDC1_BABBI|nr:Bax inhibitor-1, putative [Babesia bigemina]CDR96145.1 Bax inhibitor-1, putative [Babesia bigemina]|eukprot:XP_012768331.1 Bax inhibitor-1, putative [Babesia bigemina]